VKRSFEKKATTHDEQVELLQERGLIVEDVEQARFYLQHINYYRLGAYWLPFEEDHTRHIFKSGTHFEDVLNLYQFDREFRLLLLDAIECLEVSVRSTWAYTLAHHHGSHAHLDQSLAINVSYWQSNIARLEKEVDRSKDELFIRHFRDTYRESLPPIWVVSEVISFGLLSLWYKNLKPHSTRRAIAVIYDVDDRVFGSWLHHLTTVRNLCAHHSRLWNRDFSIRPEAPRTKPITLAGLFLINSPKIYNTLLILLYLMDRIAPAHRWRERLQRQLKNHSQWLDTMGFPEHWQSLEIWS
jgi:abortive infection bacteriophage resistance protein